MRVKQFWLVEHIMIKIGDADKINTREGKKGKIPDFFLSYRKAKGKKDRDGQD